jgi:hypothetical protein
MVERKEKQIERAIVLLATARVNDFETGAHEI